MKSVNSAGDIMARKNVLREIRGFGGTSSKVQPVKSRPKYQNHKPSTSQWEAWERLGKEDNPTWKQVWLGSMEDCFKALDEEIQCQLQDPLVKDGTLARLDTKYAHELHVIPQILERFTLPKLEKLKQQCLKEGEIKGDNWLITTYPSKFKAVQATQKTVQVTQPFAYSDYWEAWELNGTKGYFVADGSLDECLNELIPIMTLEMDILDQEPINDDLSEEEDIELFFERKDELNAQRIQQIKAVCLEKGEYRGRSWHLRSQRTREQCEYMASNGYPVCV